MPQSLYTTVHDELQPYKDQTTCTVLRAAMIFKT